MSARQRAKQFTDDREKKEQERNQPTPNQIQEWFDSLYGWQAEEFIKHTADYSEVCLCAANQVGKTRTGTGVDACHALGIYPEGWEGHRFTFPPLILDSWILRRERPATYYKPSCSAYS